MPAGLRLAPTSVDLDAFSEFVRSQGAAELQPHAASAEVMRFQIGRHRGFVSRRKDGRLTFAGVARTLYARMIEEQRQGEAP